MKPTAWLFVLSVFTCAIPTAAKQPDRVLVFNTRQQGVTCLATVDAAPLTPAAGGPMPECPLDDGGRPFLVQGERTELRVYNRKFLSDYSITIEAFTALTGPKIRNLEEAENLNLATPALIPPAKGGVEGVPAKTTADFLLMMLDASQPNETQRELEAEAQQIRERRDRIEAEFVAFSRNYSQLLGALYYVPDDCRRVAGAPNAHLLHYCLNQEFLRETSPPWSVPPFGDEREFDNVIVRVEDLLRAVKSFAASLGNSKIVDTAQTLVADVAEYRSWVLNYEQNKEAATHAVNLLTQNGATGAAHSLSESLSMQQMRNSLAQRAKDSGQTIDDKDMNEIVKRYQALLQESNRQRSLSQSTNRQGFLPQSTLNALNALPTFNQNFFEAQLNDPEGPRTGISNTLTAAINDVNAAQGKLLGRVNEIYDRSEVRVALPKQIDLNGHSGNLIVYFAIRRVETFKRYNVEQLLATPGQNPPGGNQVVALPGAAPAGNAAQPGNAGSQPSGSGQGSGNPPPNDNMPGTVVARSQLDVHDFYFANVMAAFAYSSLKDASIIKQTVPKGATDPATGKPNACTTDNCFAPIQGQRSAQLNLILGVEYYFRPRDTFPGVNHYTPHTVLQSFGFLGAISANHANNWFAGLFFEPITGAQIAGGINFGLEKRLQKNFTFGTPVDMADAFPTEDKRINKLFLSAGMDLGLFRKIFGKITGIGAPTKGTPGN